MGVFKSVSFRSLLLSVFFSFGWLASNNLWEKLITFQIIIFLQNTVHLQAFCLSPFQLYKCIYCQIHTCRAFTGLACTIFHFQSCFFLLQVFSFSSFFSLYFLLYTKYKFVIFFCTFFWAICLGIYWNLCCCCILFFSISNKMITTFFALSFFILLSLAFPSYIPTGDMYTIFSDFFSFKYGVLLLLLQHHLLFLQPPEGYFSFPFYSIAIPTKQKTLIKFPLAHASGRDEKQNIQSSSASVLSSIL